MRILHVIPSVSPLRGGPSKAIIEMVSALRNIGVTTEIATTNDDGAGELTVELNRLTEFKSVPIRFFKRFSSTIAPIREFAYSGQYRVWLKQNIDNYDIVHVHAIFSFVSSYTMYLARKRGIKYIIRPIGQLENWSLQQSRLRKLVFLRLFEQSNIEGAKGIHFTAQSEFEQARLALPRISNDRVSNREIMIIPLGIDSPKVIDDARSKVVERYNLDPKNKILLFLSRVHPKKGLELLFDALSNLEQTNYHLLIAGNGDPNYVEELEATSKKLGITRQCQFIGYQDGKEKQELLQGSDLYILTSHSENFGIAVLEALAAGTPALISQGVALAELVSGKKLGYTCEIDTVSIQSQLEYCLDKENEHELATLGQRSARHIQEHYQWTSIAEKLKSSYQKILEL